MAGCLLVGRTWPRERFASASHSPAATSSGSATQPAAQAPAALPLSGPASATPPLAAPPSKGPLAPDPSSGMPVVAERDTPDPANPALIRRVRIVRTHFKYPLWRIEETLRTAPAGQPPLVESRCIMIADHAVVRLLRDDDGDRLRDRADALGLTIRKAMGMPGCYLVSTPDPSVDALPLLLAMLQGEPDLIRYAEPDYIVQACQTVPNDPYFSFLWGLRNTSHPGADISATSAWDLTTGDTQVVVAVIDSGIDPTHPDLAPNIWSNAAETVNGIDDDGNGYIDDIQGWNFVATNNAPLDDLGHGSHCAGTIGGVGNNGTGVAGVNWRCAILPLKFLAASGEGTDSDAAEAMHYVSTLRRNGVNIRLTSNSWGSYNYASILRDAIRENASLGILCIFAAGNYTANNDVYPFYPASLGESNMIVVAATDSRDALASFSNYGQSSVHLAAPGVSILSTYCDGGYAYMNGTSMATPHVAGVATLLWNTWPTAPAEVIRDAILRGADPVAALALKTRTGGRLNARKSLETLFRILHTPLVNRYNNGADYLVEAEIGPSILADTNALALFWNTDGSTNFTRAALQNVSNSLYRAAIPMQPEGTAITYWLGAGSPILPGITAPSNAPASCYRFTIVPSLTLSITGLPDAIGQVSPAYGLQTCPSGQVFQAVAPTTTPSNGSRWACTGWSGSGSAPVSGTTNGFTFILTNDTTICWQWQHQMALFNTNDLVPALNRTTWWPEGSLATSLTAAASVQYGLTNFVFTGWTLDGARQPDASHPAINPVAGILMDQPHVVRASHLPATQDSDGDGLGDWWELYFCGTTDVEPGTDLDGDGFDQTSEFLDNTNPQDARSRPAPPAITHTALPNPAPRPAPYTVEAAITDTYRVVSATLYWSRNGAPALSNAMTLSTGSLYTATIPAPGTNHDQFAYWIIAADASRAATNGPHTFAPSYPVSSLSPASFSVRLLPETTSNLVLWATNTGTAPLHADLRLLAGGFLDDAESGSAGWSHSGSNDTWHLSTNRSVSGTQSWYCGSPVTPVYGKSMHARLDTPPVYLAPGSELTFNYWISSELDPPSPDNGWLTNKCWDGGIVEISTNNGATFMPITPVGGYPYRISGWSASPWPEMTPCFAGTGSWSQARFDLAAYTGGAARIRFHFGSDNNTQVEGWYLDDIQVTPVIADPGWVVMTATNPVIPAETVGSAPFALLDSAGIPTGDRAAVVWLRSDDPACPSTLLPVHLQVRSPPRLSWLSAAQTATNGSGIVTLSNQLHDADGDTCQMAYEWGSAADSTPWSNVWLAAVQAAHGSATFSNGALPAVSNLATCTLSGLITNLIVAEWSSRHTGDGLVFSSNAVIRGRAWDGLDWSSWTTSQPFMVDNEAPPAPVHFVSMVHRTNAWSRDPALYLKWDFVAESRGRGVAGYVYGVTASLSELIPGAETTNRMATTLPLADGTNHWAWCRSRDAAGNLSAAALYGPCGIDTTPPSAAAATVTLTRSRFGNYLVGGNSVTGSWSGFTDAGAGIDGYYVALTNGGGTPGGLWTRQLQATLSGLATDKTNMFYVWARDTLGWIGAATSASLLVLSPGGDWDHDGQTNNGEEAAGTDASDPSSRFEASHAASSGGTNGEFVIQWPALSNRLYTIFYTDELIPTSSWQVLPGYLDVAGHDGMMSCTDRTESLPGRFYRITVASP